MKWLKKSIIYFFGAIVLLLLVGFILPSHYQVERKILIEAPAENIYPNVVDLRAWSKWGVWYMRDPNMEVEFSGPDRAIGMLSVWKSDTQGSGEMRISALKHNRMVSYDLYFPEYEMSSTGTFTLEPVKGGTLVTWQDSGEMGTNPVNRYIGLMMDSMIGPDFELGLENLKTVVENQT
ncbi:SRPBCC family protein [Alteromonas sp. C1M14]|uniref:SRPBCC family protein n=1 Tax=Alteromonas sp. C1M14 TaxID=2841567 RepID=UPI001C08F6D9|nr:SRPBCC family protein [Alteromonas sp. C1M14]MBU2978976.1 SRPBCC family protein [Alteromonas sp. C1M14]